MFNLYPYLNMEDLNLDYLLKHMNELIEIVNTFISTESVTFADPILWDISTQYAKNTIVLSETGDAYLAKQPAPGQIDSVNW